MITPLAFIIHYSTYLNFRLSDVRGLSDGVGAMIRESRENVAQKLKAAGAARIAPRRHETVLVLRHQHELGEFALQPGRDHLLALLKHIQYMETVRNKRSLKPHQTTYQSIEFVVACAFLPLQELQVFIFVRIFFDPLCTFCE